MVQFKLVANKVENLKMEIMKQEEFEKEIKRIVDHQNFLIEYCQEVDKYTNAIFLNQVIVSTAIICMQLFIVSQKYSTLGEFPFPNKVKCLGYCTMEVIETAIYCFNAELLSEVSENVGSAAYNSDWYQTKVQEMRKTIALGISRSQIKTFTQIFKRLYRFTVI